MRCEIRAGGGILILAGLVGLSGAVFALGLVAGYEMARQTQPDLSQISSTYPLPNPPEKLPPVSEMSPAAQASPAVASVPPARPVSIKPPAPEIGEARPAARMSPAAVARIRPPAVAPAANPPSDEDSAASEPQPAPPRPLRRLTKTGTPPIPRRRRRLPYLLALFLPALRGTTSRSKP